MDNEVVRAIFDQQMRRDIRPDGPGVTVERVGDVVRQDGPAYAWNGVVWSDLDVGTADAAISGQVRHFSARQQEFEWKLYAHDRPDDLAGRLRAAGFTPEPEETVMVAEASGQATEVDLPDGVRLLPVVDAAGVDLLAAVHDQAFDVKDARFGQRLLAQLTASPDTVVAAVAVAGDEPVCAVRMELHEGTEFASLWGGGTAPAWRGRGIYRALVAYRARIAVERGYRYLQVDASDQSRPILQRLGFVPLCTTTPYVYQP